MSLAKARLARSRFAWKLAEQVERHRLARQKVVEDAGLAEELAPAADGVEHLAADDLARGVGEEVKELLLRDRHR
ncbi:MAG: hypothetical protein IPG04_16915 [Polyangiaceae bacterium]|nr:hypothetical protein [Polyangiaceae bacterium]